MAEQKYAFDGRANNCEVAGFVKCKIYILHFAAGRGTAEGSCEQEAAVVEEDGEME
jgi:hypothetical protein